jgi:hypothetical protein
MVLPSAARPGSLPLKIFLNSLEQVSLVWSTDDNTITINLWQKI